MILEPYIFDKKKFNDSKNLKFLSKEIHNLAMESANVKHDPTILSRDPTVRFVSIHFAEELHRADKNFQGGWQEFSRSQLANVTSYCIECHTRLREGPEISSRNATEPYVNKLSIPDQIEFMIAFRQFDSAFNLALKTLKDIQPNSEVSSKADEIARLGLLVAVQYKQDKLKAQNLVAAIEKNSSLPSYLKQKNKLWKTSLAQWDPSESMRTLSEIRILVKQRHSEIEDMQAIPALLQILTDDLSANELGEALLLTGESYESLNKISIMSLHENYYESCVRKVPKTKWAKICFRKLNDSIISGYTGSSGMHIPIDIQKSMKNLKKEIE